MFRGVRNEEVEGREGDNAGTVDGKMMFVGHFGCGIRLVIN
jgi:hypothetical protein